LEAGTFSVTHFKVRDNLVFHEVKNSTNLIGLLTSKPLPVGEGQAPRPRWPLGQSRECHAKAGEFVLLGVNAR